MILSHPPATLLTQVFGHIPAVYLNQLQEIFFERRYRAGETIFFQGDIASSIYLVAEGRVKIDRVTADGNHCILCMRGSGESFCPVSLLDYGNQLGTAWAMTDVTLLWADREAFNKVAEDYPALLAEIQKDCLLGVRRLLSRMESFAFCSVEERVADALLDESQRLAPFEEYAGEIHITQQELAGLVGASRESVSRTLSKMEQQGVVEKRRGRIIILNHKKLQRMAQHS